MVGFFGCTGPMPVSMRRGNGMGRAELPETILLGVAGIGVKLLFRRFRRGGRCRKLLVSPSAAVPPALLDLDDGGGGGADGGPGNGIPGFHSLLYNCGLPPDNVRAFRGTDGPAVGVGPADVDLRV